MNTPPNEKILKVKGEELTFILFPVGYKTPLARKQRMEQIRNSNLPFYNRIILKRHFEYELFWFYYHFSEPK